ncbi:MAG: hypothetical protein IPP46_01260 [Bacteroidetes bacterium]|nr:hypothetical protein [Bacteroidota bacterium]
MKTYYKIGIAFAFLLVNGCGQSNGDLKTNIYDNDFETIGYWTEDRGVVREAAHSGYFCTYTDTTHPYSQTLILSGKDIKNKEFKSIKAKVWVMSNHRDAKAKFVLSLEKDGKNVFWEGIETQRNMREVNKWVDVSLKIDLKEKISDDITIKLYGLNDGGRRVYWDDFHLTLE